MPTREKGRGICYGRRSTDQQESSLESQVDWAIRASAADGVLFDVTRSMLATAKATGQSTLGDLYIDDSVTGSSSQRAGWSSCFERAIADPTVSHLYVNHRDRIARPDDPAKAASLEYTLLKAGVTIVFRDRKAEPTVDGDADVVHLLTAMLDYSRGHQFLKDLSNRVLESKRMLALQGYSAGGRAPYGFGRFLKSLSGELTLLPDGRRVRQEGHHVVHLPVDQDKIAIWISVLDMKEQGLGHKRIANRLNELGIPSPDAGRTRTDGNVKHLVSGKWNPRTIAEMCRNPIIAGILQLGARSEGKHRRFSPNGSRALNAGERNGEKVRRVRNAVADRIRVKASFDPEISIERFNKIQSQINSRANSQLDIPRSKDPSKYPLSTRVVDLTCGCGSIMYGVPHTKQINKKKVHQPFYTCGRYLKTSECQHNKVDAERLLTLLLRSLKHMIRNSGSRNELTEKLVAAATRGIPARPQAKSMHEQLKSQAETLRHQRAEIAKKLAIETDADLISVFRAEFNAKGIQLDSVNSQFAELSQPPVAAATSASARVEAALKLLDNLEQLATVPEARPKLNAILRKLGIWVGLDFHEVKWGNRSVRRLRSGVISLGGYNLPVPLHGRDNREPVKPQIVGGCSTASQSAASVSVLTPGDGDGKNNGKTAKVNEKEDSSTKGNRGDRI